MPASDGSFHVEQKLGPYELVRELGRGGFGSVWLARRLGRGGFEVQVAIKLIRVEFRTDPSFQKMLIDEATLAAAIQHPNVVHIFELGEIDDVLYLVMEYVQGRPLGILRNMMQRHGKEIPVGIVMRIIADTCAGLHAAHELRRDGKALGVIHRDVSPQNILVSDKGVVKLIDFGIAKANDRLSADTTDGHTKGKLRYMAPEQALARGVDRRADIWAAGAVAYDLLEGHPPHDGHNDLARLFKLMEAGPPPLVTSSSVPAPIAEVIRKALEHDPDARWATAAAMRSAIEAALDECGLRVTPDDVATFFADALTPGDEPEGSSDRSTGAILRERLQRPSAQAATVTIDVPLVAPPVDETLSALDTSAHGLPRRRSRRAVLGLASAVSGLLVGLAVLGLRHLPHDAGAAMEQAAAMDQTPAAPSSARTATEPGPAASNGIVPPTSSVPPTEPSGAASSSPQAKPPGRPRPGRPRGTRPATPVASSSARPRYDDTIQ